MRKNKLFIAGLVTVFVALVSLTLVSSTWAKYTSTQSGSDSARVAYWGFENGATLTEVGNLFANAYANGSKQTVLSSTTDDVIAPGTTNSVTIVPKQLDGNREAEVAYTVTYSLEDSVIASELASHDGIVWVVTIGSETMVANKKWNDIAKLEWVREYTADQDPENMVITWNWKFESGVDTYDTNLGNAGSAVATIKVKLTATQID